MSDSGRRQRHVVRGERVRLGASVLRNRVDVTKGARPPPFCGPTCGDTDRRAGFEEFVEQPRNVGVFKPQRRAKAHRTTPANEPDTEAGSRSRVACTGRACKADVQSDFVVGHSKRRPPNRRHLQKSIVANGSDISHHASDCLQRLAQARAVFWLIEPNRRCTLVGVCSEGLEHRRLRSAGACEPGFRARVHPGRRHWQFLLTAGPPSRGTEFTRRLSAGDGNSVYGKRTVRVEDQPAEPSRPPCEDHMTLTTLCVVTTRSAALRPRRRPNRSPYDHRALRPILDSRRERCVTSTCTGATSRRVRATRLRS